MTCKVLSRRDAREHTRGRCPSLSRAVRRHPATRLVPVLIMVAVALATALVSWPGTAHAADPPTEPTVTSLDQVIDNIRRWLMGILFAYATLCLVVAFFRYTSGDPGEVERAKVGFRSAALGYAGAILAPLLVTIIGRWV